MRRRAEPRSAAAASTSGRHEFFTKKGTGRDAKGTERERKDIATDAQRRQERRRGELVGTGNEHQREGGGQNVTFSDCFVFALQVLAIEASPQSGQI